MAECSLAKLMHTLPPADADALMLWSETGLDGNGTPVSATQVSQALQADRTPVRLHTVRDHRGGRCVCFR